MTNPDLDKLSAAALRRTVYNLQRGGGRLCEALHRIAAGCDAPNAVARAALDNKAAWEEPPGNLVQINREGIRAAILAWAQKHDDLKLGDIRDLYAAIAAILGGEA